MPTRPRRFTQRGDSQFPLRGFIVTRSPSRRLAFTLIELLLVIPIIGILVGLLLPAVQKVREAANRSKCQNNLKQIGLTLHSYHDALGGLPGGGSMFAGNTGNNYMVNILPYVEQRSIFDKFNLAQTYNSPTNVNQKAAVVKVALCPRQPVTTGSGADAGWSMIHYAGNMGPHGLNPSGVPYKWTANASTGGYAKQGVLRPFSWRNTIDLPITTIRDGASNTIMVGELSWTLAASKFRGWNRGCGDDTSIYGCLGSRNVAYGINNPASLTAGTDLALGGNRGAGAHFVFCDGSTRYLTESIALSDLMSLASRDGGEAVSAP